MEDYMIIQLYFDRKEQAIVETEQKYGRYCNAIAWNLLGNTQDVEECVNDTYHIVWNQIPPQRPGNFQIYLGRIVRNISIDRFRANHTKKRYAEVGVMLSELVEVVPSNETVESYVEAKQLSAIIGKWLYSLPKEDCVLFVRRYWYGDSIQKLAKVRGVTANRITLRLMRLRNKLKLCLEQEGITL